MWKLSVRGRLPLFGGQSYPLPPKTNGIKAIRGSVCGLGKKSTGFSFFNPQIHLWDC